MNKFNDNENLHLYVSHYGIYWDTRKCFGTRQVDSKLINFKDVRDWFLISKRTQWQEWRKLNLTSQLSNRPSTYTGTSLTAQPFKKKKIPTSLNFHHITAIWYICVSTALKEITFKQRKHDYLWDFRFSQWQVRRRLSSGLLCHVVW